MISSVLLRNAGGMVINRRVDGLSRIAKTGVFIVAEFLLGAAKAQGADLRLADAVRIALAQNPDIVVQSSALDAARGRSMQAAGQFDLLLSSDIHYSKLISVPPGGGTQTRAFLTGYQVGVEKQLRNGNVVGIALDALSSQDSGVVPLEQLGSVVKLGVTLKLPVLKGRGRLATTAVEDAAQLNVQANRFVLRDLVSRALYQTILAYWEFRARVDLLKLALNSEERSKQLLSSNQKLVDASEKPRGDLVLLKANLADKIAAHEAAQLAVYDARTALGRSMGLDATAIGRLSGPADGLPAVVALPTATAEIVDSLIAGALERRPDLQALGLQIDGAHRLVQAAQQALLPKLDLELGVSYKKVSPSSTHFDFLDTPGRVQSGPSVEAKLSYQFPAQNSAARGLQVERIALLTQLKGRKYDLFNGVRSGVESALQNLTTSRIQMKIAQESMSLYELAVNQEMIKQKNGIATLIDVINVEMRFENSRIKFLQTQQACANATAKLRYETGTLLPGPVRSSIEGDEFDLDVSDLDGLGPLSKQLHAPD